MSTDVFLASVKEVKGNALVVSGRGQEFSCKLKQSVFNVKPQIGSVVLILTKNNYPPIAFYIDYPNDVSNLMQLDQQNNSLIIPNNTEIKGKLVIKSEALNMDATLKVDLSGVAFTGQSSAGAITGTINAGTIVDVMIEESGQ